MSGSMTKTTERNYGIDLFRIVSMLMVVVLHVLGQGGILAGSVGSFVNYGTAWFLETAAYGAVNCYALISGYVGIRAKYRYSNIATLWLQVVFYTVGMTVVHALIAPSEVGLGSWALSFIPVMGRSYWYFTYYFALFFLMPLLNLAVRSLNKRQLGAAVLGVAVLFTATSFLPGKAFGTDPFQVNEGYSILWLMLLYLIGAYVREYGLFQNLRRRTLGLIWLGCSAAAWALMMVMTHMPALVKQLFPPYTFVRYNSPLILVGSIALLVLFAKTKSFPRWLKRGIAWGSPLAFGVYLIHVNPHVWGLLKGRFAEYATAPIWVMLGIVLLAVVAIYLICTAIEAVRFYLFKLLKIKDRLLKLEQRLIGDLWG